MLIDDFLPQYDFAEHHDISINAPAESVYAAIHTLDFSGSPVIRGLFRLRGLPAASLKKSGLLHMGFIPLGETPPHEVLLGLVGQFWTVSGQLLRLDSADFRAFNQPGYAKTVWNFAITPQASGNDPIDDRDPGGLSRCSEPASFSPVLVGHRAVQRLDSPRDAAAREEDSRTIITRGSRLSDVAIPGSS